MFSRLIERQFEKIGARVNLHVGWLRSPRTEVSIDIVRDRRGELFDITVGHEEPDLLIVDTQPRLRHLLLMSRSESNEKHKFLCGHDERHWFVAAVPEKAGASTVKTAFEALRPRAVEQELNRKNVKQRNRNRRRNEAFLRQGEWFFVPSVGLAVPDTLILSNEPLRRGSGKPHMVEYLFRSGGELVYVCSRRPNGLTERQYQNLMTSRPESRGWGWNALRRNPGVYVRGKIRHADHKTIFLDSWHQVFMNTESQAIAMAHVAFID